jgi:hypothetical protein
MARVAAAGLVLVAVGAWADPAPPAPQAGSLAQDLRNPVAHLVSVPFESNFDFGGGTSETTYTGNVKPVVPFSLGKDWHLITRTIVPFVSTLSSDGSHREFGVGDIAATVYLSPERSHAGWFWGVGPGLVVPIAKDDAIGTGKWSAGPTAAVIREHGGWTFSLLTAQAWSFAGDSSRSRVNATVVQPSVSFTTRRDTSLSAGTASLYDWTEGEWTVPLELSLDQLVKVGKQPATVGLTARHGLWRPEDDASWGLVLTMTLLFPR